MDEITAHNSDGDHVIYYNGMSTQWEELETSRYMSHCNGAVVGVNNTSFFRYSENASQTVTIPGKSILQMTNKTAVCKITDEAGNTLRVDGKPAVYAKLSEAFSDFGDHYSGDEKFTLDDGTTKATPAYVKMLVPDYSIRDTDTILLPNKPLILTTAGNENGEEFPYLGETDVNGKATVPAKIRRGSSTKSMFTVNGENSIFTTTNITLDGGAKESTPKYTADNGGIVNVTKGGLIVRTGSTLQNSTTTANGGAVYVANGASMTMSDGRITGNTAVNGGAVYVDNGGTVALKDEIAAASTTSVVAATITGNTAGTAGAGIYLAEGGKLKMEGSPNFGGTDVYTDATALPDGKSVGDPRQADLRRVGPRQADPHQADQVRPYLGLSLRRISRLRES
ncbi:MAG: autotransporter adhesin family protein [Lachnospiraceae bacterium]|nr:autotransporter adhesin family protein [Lachnospiraceae bacterium]